MFIERETSKYFLLLKQVKKAVEANGKDFTNQQFSDFFEVSLKTFNDFYAGNIKRWDLLIQLSIMYEFDLILIDDKI